MSAKKHIPSYRKHSQSGQARVTLADGMGGYRDILLGKWGSAESRAEYARVLTEWEANGRRLPQRAATGDLTIHELLIGYWRHAEAYYRKNGKPTSQLSRIKLALKPVKALYGHTIAKDFGPLALKAVRDKMIQDQWTRGFINSCVGCIKRVFKWGVENELVPPSVFHGLQAVPGLKRGRTEARETEKIRPAPDKDVDATLPYLTRAVRTMVQVQRLAGMRPSEVVTMRPCDIDRTAKKKTWVYRPESHKTEHHDIARVIFLGPKAQAELAPFLLGRPPETYLFSPQEMIAEFRAKQRSERKTKVQPSQVNRKKRHPERQPGVCYSVDTYRRAIEQACQRHGIPHWHPNQLRHAKATEIRRVAGLDAARVVLGHRSPQVTEVYAEIDVDKAEAVMAKMG